MKVLKIVGGIIGVVAIAVVAGMFLLPGHVHLERSAEIDAPACNVAEVVGNLHRFNEFSPWAAKAPDAAYQYEGPEWGVGQKMSWTSEEVGSGSMTITKVDPCKRVDIPLDFGDMGKADAYWSFEAKGDKTIATWGFDEDFEGFKKYFGLMLDSMLGPDYEQGLAGLKAIAEAGPKVDIAGLAPEVVDAPSTTLAYVTITTPKDPAAVGAALGPAFGQVAAWLEAQGMTPSGPPVVVTISDAGDSLEMQVGLPIAAPPATPPAEGTVELVAVGGARAVKVVHTGSYAGLDASHQKTLAWLALRKLEVTGPSWEEFVSDPGDTPEAELVTNIWYPIK